MNVNLKLDLEFFLDLHLYMRLNVDARFARAILTRNAMIGESESAHAQSHTYARTHKSFATRTWCDMEFKLCAASDAIRKRCNSPQG